MSIVNGVTRTFGRIALSSKAHSPQILFAAGIVGVGATVVLACRATLSVEDILNQHDKDMIGVNEATGRSDKELQRDRTRVYLRTGGELAKIYSPAVICGVLSVGALAGSHNILSKRNAGLTAAYATLDKAFKGYRERVREELGEDRELELYQGAQICEIENDKGKTVKVPRAQGKGPYSYFWGPQSTSCYEVLPERNVMFLKMHERYLNQKLQARGHVFLNEVLDALGLERTTEGAVTGWLANPELGGDGYISFGIFNERNEPAFMDFMAGREDGCWLDFNVDGPIFRKI